MSNKPSDEKPHLFQQAEEDLAPHLTVQQPSGEEGRFFNQAESERRKLGEFRSQLDELGQKEAEEVARLLGISDVDLAGRWVELGFGADTVSIFPLIPLVYVAWADGKISGAERRRILDAAKARGSDDLSAGYTFLAELLEHKPREDFFETCLLTLRAIFLSMPHDRAELARQDLLSLSLSVAQSGGLLGLFGGKITEEERAMIDQIVRELDLDQSESAAALLRQL
jgi:tellurite resistance protein